MPPVAADTDPRAGSHQAASGSQADMSADSSFERLRQRALARAAPRLTHDANNALTVISGQAELAARSSADRLPARLLQIRTAAQALQRGNRLLMDLARDGLASDRLSAADDLGIELDQLASCMAVRGLSCAMQVAGDTPALDPVRLRWLVTAVILAGPDVAGNGSSMQLHLGPDPKGWLVEASIHGNTPPDWLSDVLVLFATEVLIEVEAGTWSVCIRPVPDGDSVAAS